MKLFDFIGDATPGGVIAAFFRAVYNAVSSAFRSEEIDPLSQHYIFETLDTKLNADNGTYPYNVDMAGFRSGNFHFVLSGGGVKTVKVYGSIQDDGTAPAAVDRLDITLDTFGAASFTVSDILNDNANKLQAYKWVIFEVVVTGATSDANFTIYHKRLY